MRRLVIIPFLAGIACLAQQTPASQNQAQLPPPAKEQTVTIPEGTRIPLSLASPISSKAARAGTPVRATTTFPVTVSTQLAIPAGAYLDGVIDHVTKAGGSRPTLQMHFTRLIYPNGYTVMLNGTNVQAETHHEDSNAPQSGALSEPGGAPQAFGGQQSPAPPPPPRSVHGYSGVIMGGLAGAAALAVAAVFLPGHHHHTGNALLFDTGWQFDMVLQNALVIDLGSAGI